MKWYEELAWALAQNPELNNLCVIEDILTFIVAERN